MGVNGARSEGAALVTLTPAPLPSRERGYVALNFNSLIALKFCTPPPTRLVV